MRILTHKHKVSRNKMLILQITARSEEQMIFWQWWGWGRWEADSDLEVRVQEAY